MTGVDDGVQAPPLVWEKRMRERHIGSVEFLNLRKLSLPINPTSVVSLDEAKLGTIYSHFSVDTIP